MTDKLDTHGSRVLLLAALGASLLGFLVLGLLAANLSGAVKAPGPIEALEGLAGVGLLGIGA